MKKKIVGIFVCMLLITTCVVPVYGTISVSNVKKSSVSPGDYLRFIFFGIRLRYYRMHVPSGYDGSKPMPLVVVLHGFPSNAKEIESIVDMNPTADADGFIVVYPNGHLTLQEALVEEENWGILGFLWNCWDSDKVDDIGYIRTLIENLQTTLDINSSRIYITGWSGGGFMTYRLGAELSDTVAAIAPVCGSIGGPAFWDSSSTPYVIPTPKHPVPVIIFHGMKDVNVPYNGGGVFYSVNQSVRFWVNVDHCDPIPQINISKNGNIIRKTYANGTNGTEVVFYTVVDGVHAWFGSPYFPCEISATELIWDFFAAHPKQ
jgi:polyhydroxybutyrate depolymerase